MSKETLRSKILDRVKTEKPYSKSYFQGLYIVLAFVVFAILTIVIISSTFILWDFIFINNQIPPNRRDIFNLIRAILLELIIFAGLGTWLIYFLYRKTDLPLVKNRFLLFALIVALIAGISIGCYFAVENFPPARRFFERLDNGVENIPYRRGRIPREPLLPPRPNNSVIYFYN
jgi:uncharacterized BrkB/YihY/UPF0761 family membrane protein